MERFAVGVDDVLAARAAIGGLVRRTPLVSARSLGEPLGLEVSIKAECLQKTGSFKLRGASRKLQALAEHRVRGVVTVSSGNHGQAVACAARELGMRAVILVPSATPQTKIEAARGYGADVRVGGDLNDVDRLIAEAIVIARAERFELVHPFDDRSVIAGQGTVGLELLEDAPALDAVIVPVGGGGLLAGIATALRALRPSVRVFGVGPRDASSMAVSFAAGRSIALRAMRETICDGIRTPIVGELTLPIVRAHVERVVTVEDDAVIQAVRSLWEHCQLVAEPAAACAWAALQSGAVALPPGSRVACVLSGGNVDRPRLRDWLGEVY